MPCGWKVGWIGINGFLIVCQPSPLYAGQFGDLDVRQGRVIRFHLVLVGLVEPDIRGGRALRLALEFNALLLLAWLSRLQIHRCIFLRK